MTQAAVFAADLAAVAIAAWLLVRACRDSGSGALEALTAWGLAFVAMVAGAGVILGETGGLGAAGFLAVHAAAALALAMARRRLLAADLGAALGAWAGLRRFLDSRGPEPLVACCLLLALLALSAIAGFAHPATADALTYHLPRIGQWLQDGRVSMIGSQDARMNFVATVPDLVMSWLVCGTGSGFRPAALAQAAGGLLAVAATVGLARQAGLGRGAALMAGALLLGMANVAVQFTSAQTDLFTAGVFAAAFYLWVCALRRGSGSVLGGSGAGLALGAKGTLFYLAPGALVWVAALAWSNPLPLPQWRRTLIAGFLGAMLFALPGLAHNWSNYGDPLGPREWVSKLHQGAPSPGDYLRKLKWNLTSSLAQVCEPQSQPHGLRDAGRAVAGWLALRVPEADPYTLDGMGRRAVIQGAFLSRTGPDADVTSFGMVALALFLAGSLAAVARWRGEGRLVAAWAAGVGVFVVFFHAMQQWHPFAFRYFVLAAPWVAVVSAWGIERLPGPWRAVVWAAALAAAADVCWSVTAHTHQSGWRTVTEPERSLTYFASENWGMWSEALEPAGAPLSLCLPEERPLAGFYRRSPSRQVSYLRDPGDTGETAEALVGGRQGWVVVAARRFLGREGRVAASVWLLRGDDGSPFSIAAYRALRPGERPRAVVYRDLRTTGNGGTTHELLVKTWDAAPTRFMVSNPGAGAVRYHMMTPSGGFAGEVRPAGTAIAEATLPAGSVSEVKVFFEDGGPVGQPELSVGLAP